MHTSFIDTVNKGTFPQDGSVGPTITPADQQNYWNNAISSLRTTVQSTLQNYSPKFTCYDATNNFSPVIVDLTNLNLKITNPNNKKVIGCAAPGTYLTGSRGWGGLGLGNQCIFDNVTRSTDGSLYAPYGETFDDYNIMFSVPIDTPLVTQGGYSQLIGKPRTALINNFVDFCNNNPNFCYTSGIKYDNAHAVQAIQNFIGNAGPVNNTQYDKYIHSNASTAYAWPYDDERASFTCTSSDTKYVLTISGGPS